MLETQSAPHRRPPSPHSAQEVCTSIPVSKNTVSVVHMLVELMPGPQLPAVVVLTVTYGELQLGSLRVHICVCNLGAHSVEITPNTVVGQVAPANEVPIMILPTRTSREPNSNPKKGWVLEALDLQGL